MLIFTILNLQFWRIIFFREGQTNSEYKIPFMHEIFQFLQYLFSYLLTYFSKAKLAWQRWYLISMLLRFHEIFYNIFSSFGRLDFCSIFLIFVAFIELAKQWHTINMIFMKLCFHEFFFRSFGGLDFGCSNRIQIMNVRFHEFYFSSHLSIHNRY